MDPRENDRGNGEGGRAATNQPQNRQQNDRRDQGFRPENRPTDQPLKHDMDAKAVALSEEEMAVFFRFDRK